MATRFLHRGLGAPEAVGNAVGIGEDSNGALALNQSGASATSVFITPHAITTASAATTTLTVALNGTIVACATSVSQAVVLPSCKPGLVYGIVVSSATTTGGHKLIPAATEQIVFSSLAAGSGAQCTAASDVVGDRIIVMGGPDSKWYPISMTGTWAAVAGLG